MPTLLQPLTPFIHIPEVHEACVRHDHRYYLGGSRRARALSDVQVLFDWLAARTPEGEPAIPIELAHFMFDQVRIFGGPEGRQPYSWGHGDKRWQYDDEPATEEEGYGHGV